ncbi:MULTISPECIES: CGNR zinc finger domain-containing protein [unclassified Brevibacterium]|uniref:CGNR zinc finger domain-containing protein n=1 Tax=unclassified Brevibacterium TaxID=2614124 RepID=UPI001F0EAC61|nr:CGNR zinc finger domain-containing protein [Brevibacterium sp. S22]
MLIEDEGLLIAVLNSAPVVDGLPTEQLDSEAGAALVNRFGGAGTGAEFQHLHQVRDALQSMIRGEPEAVERLAAAIDKTALLPEVTHEGIHWVLDAPADKLLAARVVLAWSRVMQELPGRLRACANTECNLFLLDHSRPGTAKWCSMSTCGNRMKVRAHAQRLRELE